jgi:hypothetical protein
MSLLLTTRPEFETRPSLSPQQLTHNADIDQDRAPAWRPG